MDEDDWPNDQEQRQEIVELWKKPWGDRRQEIVVIGQSINQDTITAKFDACLLTSEEMELGPEKWIELFNDPFHEWQEVIDEEYQEEETLIRS